MPSVFLKISLGTIYFYCMSCVILSILILIELSINIESYTDS